MSDPWAIVPWRGLGPLRFDMSPAEVAEHDAIYGVPKPSSDLSVAAEEDIIRRTLDEFRGTMPAKELAELETMMRASLAASEKRLTEVRAASGVTLDYAEGALEMIHIAPDARRTHFDGLAVFTDGSVAVASTLGKANGGDLLIVKSYVYLDRLGIYLSDFVERGRNGLVAVEREEDAMAVSLNARDAEIDTKVMTRIRI